MAAQLHSDELITVRKSNRLIQAIGSPTLLANKVFLTSLIKLENRNGEVSAAEKEYYTNLENISGTDFSKGLVAEFTNSELRRHMNSKSGSYYEQIKELMDPMSKKSLKNQWVIMVKDAESGVYGSTDIITSTLYDDHTGKMYIKYSSEEKIQKELFNLISNYASLPYNICMGLKSVFSYRLFELLMSWIGYDEGTYKVKRDEYSYTRSLSELKYLLGILPTDKKEVRQALSSQNPDFEKIEHLVSDEHPMPRYNDFERYTLAKFKKELAEVDWGQQDGWEFSYTPVRNGRGGKVTAVTLTMTRIHKNGKKEHPGLSEDDQMDFLDELRDLLSSYRISGLKTKELRKIAEAASWDYDRCEKAANVLGVYRDLDDDKVENPTGFLIKAIKEKWAES